MLRPWQCGGRPPVRCSKAWDLSASSGPFEFGLYERRNQSYDFTHRFYGDLGYELGDPRQANALWDGLLLAGRSRESARLMRALNVAREPVPESC
jgi:hypothetical protein